MHVALRVVGRVGRPVHGRLGPVERAEVGEVSVRGGQVERVAVACAFGAVHGRLVDDMHEELIGARSPRHVVDAIAQVEEHELTVRQLRAVVGQLAAGERTIDVHEEVLRLAVGGEVEARERLAVELRPHEDDFGPI